MSPGAPAQSKGIHFRGFCFIFPASRTKTSHMYTFAGFDTVPGDLSQSKSIHFGTFSSVFPTFREFLSEMYTFVCYAARLAGSQALHYRRYALGLGSRPQALCAGSQALSPGRRLAEQSRMLCSLGRRHPGARLFLFLRRRLLLR